MKTTLQQILKHAPCGQTKPTSGYLKLRAHLGEDFPYAREFELLEVYKSNGFDDTVWCLRAVTGMDTEIRQFAFFGARQTFHLIPLLAGLEEAFVSQDENLVRDLTDTLLENDDLDYFVRKAVSRVRASVLLRAYSAAYCVTYTDGKSPEQSAELEAELLKLIALPNP